MRLDLSKNIDRTRAAAYMNKLIEKGAKIELKQFKPKRSLSQNSYLHLALSIIANESGYSLAETKTLMKRQYGLMYEKNGQKFLKSTSQLDTKEMTDFIDFLRSFSLEQLGAYILSPEEFLENQFYVLKELDHVK